MPEVLVMSVRFNVSPSESVTLPLVPKPVPPDVTVTPEVPRISKKLVGTVPLLPTFIPAMFVLTTTPLVVARSPAEPRNVNVFPVPGAVSSCKEDAALLSISNTSPELAATALTSVRVPPVAVMVSAVPLPDRVNPASTVPKPLSEPFDVPVPNVMFFLSVMLPPVILIVPRVTFCCSSIVSLDPTSSV